MQEIIQFAENHFFLVLIEIILLCVIAFNILKSRLSKIYSISNNEAICLINKKDAIVVDLRERHDYYKGHITNSVNLMCSDIKSGNLGKINNVKGKPVIIVNTNGAGSLVSAKYLMMAGFDQVYILKDGIYGWRREHLPLIRR